MAPSALKVVGVVAVAAGLLGAAIRVQAAREAMYPLAEVGEESLYLTSGTTLRHMTVGLNALAADVYWIRAIQHYGGTKQRLEAQRHAQRGVVAPGSREVASGFSRTSGRDYDQLFPLLDVTTTLDPRFKIAYRFGAVFLAETYPNGAGRPDLAVQLLQKGLRAEPDKWEYMEDIGFVHYWYDHDYRAAASAFQQASEAPGAPWWLRSLAATTLIQGGDRQSSRTMWRAIQESAEIDWLRADADRRLAQLDALDQVDALQRVVDERTRQTGRPVRNWPTLVVERVIRGIPLDPAGTPYELTPEGRVQVAMGSPLWPLPDEPDHLERRQGS